MFHRLGRGIVARPWVVIISWAAIMIFAAYSAFVGFGDGGIFSRMSSKVSLVPGSQSDRVINLTQGDHTSGTSTVIVTGIKMDSDYPKLATFMTHWREQLAKVDHVSTVTDPFQLPDPTLPQAQAMMSNKGDGFVFTISLAPGLDQFTEEEALDDVTERVDDFNSALGKEFPGAHAEAISDQIITRTLTDQVRSDLYTGEAISLPISLLLMVIVFGGLLAAGLPLISALLTIVITLGMLLGLTYLIDIQSYILNVISLIGIALSIDYGLFVVSRYREESHLILADAGFDNRTSPGTSEAMPDPETARDMINRAVVRTVATAGRTVGFSALTIAFSVSALLVIKAPLIKSIAIGSVLSVLLAVLTAVTFVPATLALSGHRLLKPSAVTRIPGLRRIIKAVGDSSSDEGVFSKLARTVHKYPWPIMLVLFGLLIVMTLPLQHTQVRAVFTDYIPRHTSTWTTWSTIQDDYPALAEHTATVIADTDADVGQLRDHIAHLDGVTWVSDPVPLPNRDDGVKIDVQADFADQAGDEATQLVKSIRSYDAGYPIYVGGPAALQYDFVSELAKGALPACAIAVAAVLVLLFLMTGSIIVPIKALIINTLSWIASFGTTVFILKHGLFGIPQQPGITAFVMACGLAFGFGLAMDYEVFLLARIKEEWDLGRTNDEAVEYGLQRSGRIITSAAVIIVAVFIGFVFGKMMAVKEIGILLAITVAVDATLVRMLLVPATMTVLGKWNWWAPKPLAKLYQRFGIKEAPSAGMKAEATPKPRQ